MVQNVEFGFSCHRSKGADTVNAPVTDREFDEVHGGRELLPIEQAIYEAEGAERFAGIHGHGRRFPKQAEIGDRLASQPDSQEKKS